MVNLPHMLKYVGSKGLYLNIKGPVFFLAIKATTWLWFGMVICIHHPQHQRYMGRASAGIDVLGVV